VISAIFTFEFAVRLSTTWNKRDFLLSPLNMFDICSFLPFYVELIVSVTYSSKQNVDYLRVLRLFRMLKVLRLARSLKNYFTIFKETLVLARPSLMMLFNITTLFAYVMSVIMYNAEQNTTTGENTFVSVFEAMYWCFVTMTTVGYGDIPILTHTGRLLACIAAFMGIMNLTLIINVMGSCFDEAYTRFLDNEERDFKMRLELEMGPKGSKRRNRITDSKIKSIALNTIEEKESFLTEQSIQPLAKNIAELNFQLSKENFCDALSSEGSDQLWKLMIDAKDLLDVHLAK